MIEFIIDASWVYIRGDGPVVTAAAKVLHDSLRVKNPQAHMINQRRTWPGAEMVPYYHMAFDWGRFPRGLLVDAASALTEAGIPWQVGEITIPSSELEFASWDLSSLMPRDYQLHSVQAWACHGNGMVVIPTRGGKTVVGCLAASMAAKNMPVLWLTTKTEAQGDVLETWEQHFSHISLATDQHREASQGLTVLTYATATKRDLSKYGMVIADEVHRVPADSYYKALQSCESAWYRLGMSGTIEGRADGKDFFARGAFGPVRYEVPRSLLIERGFCSSGKVLRVSMTTPISIPDGRGNWTEIEKVGIVENKARNYLLITALNSVRQNDEQVLVLCRRKSHAEAFAAQLADHFQTEVPAVHSSCSKKVRQDVYERLSSGELKFAVGTGIYDDSMTFPHLRILVMAAGGKSPIVTGQRMGRVLSGDKEIVIIDCDDKFYPTLSNHSKKRFRVYKREGYPAVDWEPGKEV